MIYDLIVLGGGAAGYFSALSAKEENPTAKVAIFEKAAVVLSKVRISGGGRCNVTHACFDPNLLCKNYPRGSKELIGPFHQFGPTETIEWFQTRGVRLKAEEDGRMFPITDSSETIIDCLVGETKKLGIELHLIQRIESIEKIEDHFVLKTKDGHEILTKKLVLATGSQSDGHRFAKELGHTIQEPVPSLFTFNVPDSPLQELSGIAFESVKLQLKDISYTQTGPLLITHFGFSGPAALKLSAWAARELYQKKYCVELIIQWLPQLSLKSIVEALHVLKQKFPQKTLIQENPFHLPRRFWKFILGKIEEKKLNDIPLKELDKLAERLYRDVYQVQGKTTNKEEFVTCGGVTLKEVNFKTMESKICPGLYFAGEILDIDGITGGFNFQNAWTTGYIAGSNAVSFHN